MVYDVVEFGMVYASYGLIMSWCAVLLQCRYIYSDTN